MASSVGTEAGWSADEKSSRGDLLQVLEIRMLSLPD